MEQVLLIKREELWKKNVLRMAEHHKKHCEGRKCNVSLYALMKMSEAAGVEFTEEESTLFV